MTFVPAGVSPAMLDIEPKAGDFAVFQTSGWTADLTGLGTRSEFTHAGLCDGQGNVIEALGSGVRRAPLSRYDGVNYLLSTSFVGVGDNLRGTILDAGEVAIGTPYDYECIAYIIARRLWHEGPAVDVLARRVATHWPDGKHPTKVICSALVAHCWAVAGIDLVEGKAPWQVTPGDLASLLTHGRIPGDY